jgi:hypothetical protein
MSFHMMSRYQSQPCARCGCAKAEHTAGCRLCNQRRAYWRRKAKAVA